VPEARPSMAAMLRPRTSRRCATSESSQPWAMVPSSWVTVSLSARTVPVSESSFSFRRDCQTSCGSTPPRGRLGGCPPGSWRSARRPRRESPRRMPLLAGESRPGTFASDETCRCVGGVGVGHNRGSVTENSGRGPRPREAAVLRPLPRQELGQPRCEEVVDLDAFI
jgi:hypothetical protein